MNYRPSVSATMGAIEYLIQFYEISFKEVLAKYFRMKVERYGDIGPPTHACTHVSAKFCHALTVFTDRIKATGKSDLNLT